MADKSNKNNKELNKKRGKRLRECRELRNYTQDALGSEIYLSGKYISMLENGYRPLDWNKAHLIADILNVNASYLMCKTDLLSCISRPVLDSDTFGCSDKYLLNFLISIGYVLEFYIVNLHDGKKPEIKNIPSGERYDYSSLQIPVGLDALSAFSLSDIHCRAIIDDEEIEAVIVAISINGYKLNYGKFCFWINRLYDYIYFAVDSLKEWNNDWAMQEGANAYAENEIAETRLSDIEREKIVSAVESGDTMYIEKILNLNPALKPFKAKQSQTDSCPTAITNRD